MTAHPPQPHVDAGSWLIWLDGAARSAVCPACGAAGPMPELVSVRNPFTAERSSAGASRNLFHAMRTWLQSPQSRRGDRIIYVRCNECGSLPSIGFTTPDYRDDDIEGAALKFAKEQGAGVSVMLRPLYWIDRTGVSTFLDVGGGYGFALDAARTLFGWTVRGADPSSFARIGARELGLEIDDVVITEAGPAKNAPYDLVLASEVIEHVDDPVAFARALRASAGPRGRVLITTPDAERITPESDPSVALMGLAPGSHVLVLSRKGLERVLQAAGFGFVRVIQRNNSLIAAAGAAPFAFDPSSETPPEDYAAYLRGRAAELPEMSDLRCGLLGRLARAEADAERWDDLDRTLASLAALFRTRYAIDLDQPQTWSVPSDGSFHTLVRLAPANLGVVFYVVGLMWLNRFGRRKAAREAFEASQRACEALRAALRSVGADDLEQGEIAARARILALRCRVWEEPEGAAEAVLADWRGQTGPEMDRVETLMNLVIAGANETGPLASAAIEEAELWLRPVLSGQRRTSGPSEREALDALARRYEARGLHRLARPWRLAAALEADDPERMASLRVSLATLDGTIETDAARTDRESVVRAAATDRHADAAAAAARMIARGPNQPAMTRSERVALALHCLVHRNDPEAALHFLHSAGSADAGDDVTALFAEARQRCSPPDRIAASLMHWASAGRWAEMERHLDLFPHSPPADLNPDVAFALAMYHLNASGDAEMALACFERASSSQDRALSVSARVHAAECLMRLRRPADAALIAADLLENSGNSGDTGLADYRLRLKSYLSAGDAPAGQCSPTGSNQDARQA